MASELSIHHRYNTTGCCNMCSVSLVLHIDQNKKHFPVISQHQNPLPSTMELFSNIKLIEFHHVSVPLYFSRTSRSLWSSLFFYPFSSCLFLSVGVCVCVSETNMHPVQVDCLTGSSKLCLGHGTTLSEVNALASMCSCCCACRRCGVLSAIFGLRTGFYSLLGSFFVPCFCVIICEKSSMFCIIYWSLLSVRVIFCMMSCDVSPKCRCISSCINKEIKCEYGMCVVWIQSHKYSKSKKDVRCPQAYTLCHLAWYVPGIFKWQCISSCINKEIKHDYAMCVVCLDPIA